MQQSVQALRDAGIATIRVASCSKRPIGAGWQDRIDEPEAFQPGENVGIRLGSASGGVVDVDLDCGEAVALAPAFLPTTATFGRPGKPRSHWIYRAPGAKTRKPPRTHVELRAEGCQTVVPPSIHETGEPITWADETPITTVTVAELEAAFGRLCAATVIARVFRDAHEGHDAHDLALALAGALWHAGWSCDDALALLLPPMELGGGPDTGHREAAIRDTWDDHDRNRRGWPTVAELVGPVDAKAIERALELVPATPRALTAGGVLVGADGAAMAIRPLTDAGNAERFVDDHGEDLRYAPGIGWLQWDGVRWIPLGAEPVELAIRSARKLQAQGAALGQPAITKWGVASEGVSKLRASVLIASNLSAIRVKVDELDADPWLLNCPNGTIDLRTGVLRPHARGDLITKCAGVAYDPAAEAPRFGRFLQEVMGGDQELAAYLLRFLGYSLAGEIREHVFGLWHGGGRNGKGVAINTMLHVMGDYAGIVDPSILLEQSSPQHSSPLTDLRGRRFVAGNELPEGKRWNEARVKTLCGGDRITARRMRQDNVEFDPTHKLVLACNSLPLVREHGNAFWSRVALIPWEVSFLGREELGLQHTLRGEGPGILAALVWGCREWQRIGLSPPARVREAGEGYRSDQDAIGTFIEECLERSDAFVGRSSIYSAFRIWAAQAGEHVLAAQAFYRILGERGFQAAMRRGVRGFVGWAVRSSAEAADFGARDARAAVIVQ